MSRQETEAETLTIILLGTLGTIAAGPIGGLAGIGAGLWVKSRAVAAEEAKRRRELLDRVEGKR